LEPHYENKKQNESSNSGVLSILVFPVSGNHFRNHTLRVGIKEDIKMKLFTKWSALIATCLLILSFTPEGVMSQMLFDYTGPQNRTYEKSVETDRYCHYVYYWNGTGSGCWNGSTFNSSCSINTRDSYVLASNCTLDIPDAQVSSKCGCSAGDWKPWNGEPDPKLVKVVDTTTVSLPPATVAGTVDCAGTLIGEWCKGSASVTINGNEPVSGYAITGLEANTGWSSSGNSAILDGPEGTTALEYWAVSSYGDTSLKGTASLKQDTLPPTYTLNVPAANADGWYQAPITVTLSGSDAGSGIAVVQIVESGVNSMSLNTEGIFTLNYYLEDNVGWSTTGSSSFQLDFTPPTLMAVFPAPDGANGWYVTPPTISVSGTDALSGIASEAIVELGSQSATLPNGIHSNLTFQVTDNAGNVVSETHSFLVDTSQPALSVSHDAASTLLTGGVVNFNGSATDGTSSLALTQAFVDGASSPIAPDVSGNFTFSVDFDSLADGPHEIQFVAEDMAGNQTTQEFSFTKDNSPPSITLPASWRLGQSVVIQASDVVSGITTCTLTISESSHSWSTTFTGEVDTTFKWDGNYSDGTSAEYGNHKVTMDCEDTAGLSSSSSATISNPKPPTPTPTATKWVRLFVPTLTPLPSLTPTLTSTASPTATITATQETIHPTASQTETPPIYEEVMIEPTPTLINPTATPTVTPAAQSEAITPQKIALVPALGFALAAIASLALFDPRPPAWHAIADVLQQSINKFNH
jgi:hypothetical protein